MQNDIWNSGSGDWNDSSDWSLSNVPTLEEAAVLIGRGPETISGTGSFYRLDIGASQVTLAGDFEASGDSGWLGDTMARNHVDSSSAEQTLTIAAWSFIQTSEVDFSHTGLLVNGEMLLDHGSASAVTVSGGEGFLGVNSELQVSSLTVLEGASVSGDLSVQAGGQVTVDDQSSLGEGTLSASGSAAIYVEATGSSSETFTFTNSFSTTDGGCISFSSSSGVTLSLEGNVSGTGTLAFASQAISVADGTSLAGTFDLTASSMEQDVVSMAGLTSFNLDGSSLQFGQTWQTQSDVAEVTCGGARDTVIAGAAILDVSATGTAALSFEGGTGWATVKGGAGTLSVSAGTGDTDVVCGSSGDDRVTVGAGNDIVQGSSGAHIAIIGGGTTTITAEAGNELVDGSGTTGHDTYFGGSGGGVTTIRGGAGSAVVAGNQGAILAVGGTGSFDAWGGTSGQDTLIGGTGADTLAAAVAGDRIYGFGSGANVLVALSGGILLDASRCSGGATVFAIGGSEATTLVGGSGSETLVTQYGNGLILGGSGTEMIWGGLAAPDTIIGGTGNSTMVGAAGSSIELNGSANDDVVAYGGNSTVNATAFSGTAAIFAEGSGITFVTCGGGDETVVAATGTLHAVGGRGYNAIFGGSSGRDTIIGGSQNNALFGDSGAFVQAIGSGADYIQASGSNVTLNGAAASGWDEFVCTAGSSNTDILTGQNVSDVRAMGVSASIHVVGGQVSLECGGGTEAISLDAVSIAGTLNIFGFNPTLDTLSAPGVPDLSRDLSLGATESGGTTTFRYGNETVMLHGFAQPGHF